MSDVDTVIKRAQEVADKLRGSSGMLKDHTTPEEMENDAFCAELDLHVFECDCCGWWCGDDEKSEYLDGQCRECDYESDEEDEDEDDEQ